MPTGLIRRTGARYSTRRVIPLDLREHYGKREIVIALGTADPSEARRRHVLTWVAMDKDFAERRIGIAPAVVANPDDAADIGHRTLAALRKRRDIAQANGPLGEFMAANREEIPDTGDGGTSYVRAETRAALEAKGVLTHEGDLAMVGPVRFGGAVFERLAVNLIEAGGPEDVRPWPGSNALRLGARFLALNPSLWNLTVGTITILRPGSRFLGPR